MPAGPVHLQIDLLAVVEDGDDDPLDEQPHDGLALGGRGRRGLPQGGDIAGELADARPFRRRQRRRAGVEEARILGLELGLGAERRLPMLLEGARHQAIFRLDRLVLAFDALGLVTGALQALLPVQPLAGPLGFEVFGHLQADLQRGRL